MKKNFFSSLAFFALVFSIGCGEIVSNFENSKVYGENLVWDNQPSINGTNIVSYAASGRCVGTVGTDVTISVGNPVLASFTIPCVSSRFSTVLDLSASGLVPGNVELLSTQVNIPVQALTTVLLDVVAPPAPTIITPANGTTIYVSSPLATGLCQAGTTVFLTGDLITPVNTPCDLTGNYSVAVDLIATNGSKTINALQEDVAGNISPSVNSTFNLVVPPIAPTIGTPVSGLVTRFVSQTVSGTCEVGATVNVISSVVGAPVTNTCTAGGTYSIPVTLTAANGSKVINVNQTNLAGTSPNASVTVTLDTAAPAAPTIAAPANGSFINTVSPNVTGSCEANATVSLIGDIVGAPVTTVCTGGGTYTRSITFTAGDGVKTITADQTDLAGNISASANSVITLDTVVPTVVVSSTAPSTTTVSPIPFTITFSENVSGFVSGDITVTNGSIGSFSGGPSVYNITVNPVAFGAVTVSVAMNRAIDSAGNGNSVSNTLSITYEAAMVMSYFLSTQLNMAVVTQGAVPYNIQWGDGTQTLNVASSSSVFTSRTLTGAPLTGTARIFGIQPSQILELRHSNTNSSWTYDIQAFPPNLTTYVFSSGPNCDITGDIGNLPPNLVRFECAGSNQNTTFGDIANLPAGLQIYINRGNNLTTGNIAALPSGLITFNNQGSNTTSGSIASLPVGLTLYQNQGSNTTSGNISGLPLTLQTYNNQGSNTTTGDIATLTTSLTAYTNLGSNTTFGDIGNLKNQLILFSNQGSNTTSGSLINLKPTLQTYVNRGNNTVTGAILDVPASVTNFESSNAFITGNLADISPTVTRFNINDAPITGDIADIPASVTFVQLGGSNTTFGDIANLKPTLTNYQNTGSNTVTGDIANIPASITFFISEGSNTNFGNIANLKTGLATFSARGSNTVTGDIANLPATLNFFYLSGSNTTFGSINTFKPNLREYTNAGFNTTTATGTAFLPLQFNLFTLLDATVRSQTEIDNILISLASQPNWRGVRSVDLRGSGNATPGPSGLAARALLQTYGVTVLNN